MKGKVCVITGGTDGIGKAAAHQLGLQGARLLIHGRDGNKGARAAAELKERTGNPEIEFLQADFASLAEVRRLAAAVRVRTARLDVLINNAGGFTSQRHLSQDGYELTLAVNHLAPFLLTHLLLDLLKASSPSRIVTTASGAHKGARIDFDDLQSTGRYHGLRVYGMSKLANILFTRALARRLQGTGVTATCLHPGFVRSQIGRGIEGVGGSIFGFLSRFARSPDKGAETLVYLAASPLVEGASGGYYFDCKEIAPSPAAQNDTDAQRLWDLSTKLVGIE